MYNLITSHSVWQIALGIVLGGIILGYFNEFKTLIVLHLAENTDNGHIIFTIVSGIIALLSISLLFVYFYK